MRSVCSRARGDGLRRARSSVPRSARAGSGRLRARRRGPEQTRRCSPPWTAVTTRSAIPITDEHARRRRRRARLYQAIGRARCREAVTITRQGALRDDAVDRRAEHAAPPRVDPCGRHQHDDLGLAPLGLPDDLHEALPASDGRATTRTPYVSPIATASSSSSFACRSSSGSSASSGTRGAPRSPSAPRLGARRSAARRHATSRRRRTASLARSGRRSAGTRARAPRRTPAVPSPSRLSERCRTAPVDGVSDQTEDDPAEPDPPRQRRSGRGSRRTRRRRDPAEGSRTAASRRRSASGSARAVAHAGSAVF